MSGTSDAAAGGRIAESEQTGAEDAADMDEDDELERELERELAEEEANLEREIERELAKEEADAEAAGVPHYAVLQGCYHAARTVLSLNMSPVHFHSTTTCTQWGAVLQFWCTVFHCST